MAMQKTRQRKLTEYGTQLVEKQKAKNAYGLREKQFRRYYDLAAKFRGKTGEMLLQMLERRLDNVLFRSGFVKSRREARQLISHRHIVLNGRRVSVPSILVDVKDKIEPNTSQMFEYRPETPEVSWLDVDKKTKKITIKNLPAEADLPLEYDTQKIVEFYSR